MLLQMRSALFKYGNVTVFENVNLDVNERDNIGLVGPNGAGKSTLLSVIAEDAQLFDGSVSKRNGLTLGYLKQNCDFDSQNTLFDEMMSVFSGQTKLLDEINQTATEMSLAHQEPIRFRMLSDKFQRLSAEADATDAYKSELKVKTVLNGMGMAQYSDRIVSTLSGGEKTKAALCKLLLLRPELMILDEPTNHLDYKTLDWLEDFLSDKKSTLIVVSHDRYFLNRLCTSIWDIQQTKIEVYEGNYSQYKVLKNQRIESRCREYEKQQKEISKLNEYIEKNKVRASTANMAKSREKALAKLEPIDMPPREEMPPRFCFSYSSESSEIVLSVKNLNVEIGNRLLLKNGEFQIKRGQKIALLGLNGAGKSTLLKRLANPSAAESTKIVFGKNVRIGYYDQENQNLNGQLRVLDQFWLDNPRMSQAHVRSLLAAVGLGADDVYKLVSDLSGGERARLGLAMIMAKDCNFLLLDEPTNHLDLPSREALEQALNSYSGTLLFVSHDRYFVNSIADSILELNNQSLTLHSGNYDNFVNRNKQVQTAGDTKAKGGKFRSPKERAAQVNRSKRLNELEKQISSLEADIQSLNNQLSQSDVVREYQKTNAIMKNLQEAETFLEELIKEWESIME